jgi:hypothetical protein
MINIITYDIPHRKTQDTLKELLFRGYNNITLFVIPFEKKNGFKPIYSHRPRNVIEKPRGEKLINQHYESHRRMSHRKEVKMMEIFNNLRLNSQNKT